MHVLAISEAISASSGFLSAFWGHISQSEQKIDDFNPYLASEQTAGKHLRPDIIQAKFEKFPAAGPNFSPGNSENVIRPSHLYLGVLL